MYSKGELIFYGKTGVCEVVDITEMTSPVFEGQQLYYILKPLYQECNISIPVNNDKVFMRPVISKERVDELIDEIPNMDAPAYYSQNLNQLKNHYKDIMESHNISEMIRLIISVRAKEKEVIKNKKKLGAVDERYMKEAEELLFGEFAAVLNIPKKAVLEYIAKRLSEEI